jgi:hypothetical protein
MTTPLKAGFYAKRYDQFTPFDVRRKLIGWNTGNLVFQNAIEKMISCDVITVDEPFQNDKYNAFITTDLIWLKENVKPWELLFQQLELAKDKPLIPLSIGLQTAVKKKDFVIHPNMKSYLQSLQERTPLAVRGAYTAEILDSYGISNVKILGCPSIYQLPLYNKSLKTLLKPCPEEINAAANFRTPIGHFEDNELLYLRYVVNDFEGFIEQTFESINEANGADRNIINWLKKKSHIFFDLDSWRRHNLRYNFSMGLRFHGNVAALLAGIPALFVVIDSRTSEMTDFFHLPSLNFKHFNDRLPLTYYYRKADYGNFVSSYREKMDDFKQFILSSGLKFSDQFETAMRKFSF